MRHALGGALMLAWLSFSGCSGGPDRGLPAAYRSLPVPAARLAAAEARARGRSLFLRHCALCHGERADGHGQRREALSTPPADFTSPAWRQRVTPRTVYFTIREGVNGTPMPAWRTLSEDESWDVAAYVLSAAGEDAR